jgi:predicted N-acetyltransferase YhbS
MVVIRVMQEGEREAVLDLLEGAFGVRGIFVRYMDCDPLLHCHDTLLAIQKDTPVSCVQIFTKRIRLRGSTVEVGGIGSVATATSQRGRGLSSLLLRRAILEMQRRGMALSLLFTGLRGFYERLGFVPVARRRWLLHRAGDDTGPPAGTRFRDFTPDDLPAVRRIYEEYSGTFECSTVRDASYWRGQLGYAGNPSEIFRLAECDRRIVAYARVIEMNGAQAATEFARSPDAPGQLAALLAGLIPADAALICSSAPDAELEHGLESLGVRLQDCCDSESLWRVLDRGVVTRLAGLPKGSGDPELLEALVGSPRALYWPSDRF